MKIALITDTHFGVRQDNISLLDFQKRFLDDVFFPTIAEQNIKHVIHLGDLVDRRKYINFNTYSRVNTDFLMRLEQHELAMYIIAGNHDIYYKNSLSINSLREMLRDRLNFEVIDYPQHITFGSAKIAFIPWICDDNREECMKFIRESDADYCFGHFELQGFEMHKGTFCDHGQDPALLSKFDLVCSGHFHHRSTYKKLNYLGSPWETTWADYGDTKGFHILDTDTNKLEFIENPYKLFNKVRYNDVTMTYDQLFDTDFSQYKDSYVKLIVTERNNPFWFDNFVTKLEECGAIDVQVVEDHLNLNMEDPDEIIDQAESTIDILFKSVTNIGLDPDKEKRLENLLRTLYNDASVIQA